jgi:hypothetical protein
MRQPTPPLKACATNDWAQPEPELPAILCTAHGSLLAPNGQTHAWLGHQHNTAMNLVSIFRVFFWGGGAVGHLRVAFQAAISACQESEPAESAAQRPQLPADAAPICVAWSKTWPLPSTKTSKAGSWPHKAPWVCLTCPWGRQPNTLPEQFAGSLTCRTSPGGFSRSSFSPSYTPG